MAIGKGNDCAQIERERRNQSSISLNEKWVDDFLSYGYTWRWKLAVEISASSMLPKTLKIFLTKNETTQRRYSMSINKIAS
jgi:hypothetical protein